MTLTHTRLDSTPPAYLTHTRLVSTRDGDGEDLEGPPSGSGTFSIPYLPLEKVEKKLEMFFQVGSRQPSNPRCGSSENRFPQLEKVEKRI